MMVDQSPETMLHCSERQSGIWVQQDPRHLPQPEQTDPRDNGAAHRSDAPILSVRGCTSSRSPCCRLSWRPRCLPASPLRSFTSRLSFLPPSFHACIHPPLRMSVRLSIHPSLHPSIHPSIQPSNHPSISPPSALPTTHTRLPPWFLRSPPHPSPASTAGDGPCSPDTLRNDGRLELPVPTVRRHRPVYSEGAARRVVVPPARKRGLLLAHPAPAGLKTYQHARWCGVSATAAAAAGQME